MKILSDYNLSSLNLKNRVVMPAMCMRAAQADGRARDFHRSHYEARALGGVGLIIVEATAVTPNGRISDQDLGLWNDGQVLGLTSLANNVKKHGSKVALQLNHAGRKSRSTNEYRVAPSSLAFSPGEDLPRELTKEEIGNIIRDFTQASLRADRAGFDALEIHGAHGFLIHEFLSPISNKRRDAYGGSLANRARFPKEVLASIRKHWPSSKPLILRLSASDYLEGGLDIKETIEIVKILKPFIDMVHVSSGGIAPLDRDFPPLYQVKFAQAIRDKCQIPTIAVGLIDSLDQGEEILLRERADLVAYGRKLLREPQFILNTAYEKNLDYDYPSYYRDAFI